MLIPVQVRFGAGEARYDRTKVNLAARTSQGKSKAHATGDIKCLSVENIDASLNVLELSWPMDADASRRVVALAWLDPSKSLISLAFTVICLQKVSKR